MQVARFHIPSYLNASIPAEYRGMKRDEVRMMSLDTKGRISHLRFHHLVDCLRPGDLLVLNNSRTIPAVLYGKKGKQTVEIRLSQRLSAQEWEAVVIGMVAVGDQIMLPGDVQATIVAGGSEKPLVILRFSESSLEFIYKYGRPIRYEYIDTPWPLDAYQTVYASVPGSVEMPSAGRAFTWGLLNQLQDKGIGIAFLQLHTGLGYYGNDQWANPKFHHEAYAIPQKTATLINETQKRGGRIIAVGTTVVRALETAANDNGEVTAKAGTTNLYIRKDYKLRVADGLITGFHEPEASHLDLLTAFIQEDVLLKAYQEALQQGYLWHEFGDMNLILPADLQ
ncbi:S-adenosylmethionine:tRNA ribosyltransferase-isomerase [Ectobacillus antri]|jgi:S-adenosylmethionine:tRNA ribosyltransferase-isomerase|uniref:S-adenosylmethionine:tRNA ribosyltransferase-isomerase n=1 Tax=Ectobacillus antri TaxID=2486280 RepID=A0ABT6H7W7_9BACI|nr:S-adenosylmethionine:tRNA ribosyltransferase-isomerase [Ectobacillus antri]MDG4658433.1 S-adenosylmethionine:tRNA ribosyltransferase-isomerase [Ectobacillus antri]MDG5755430.1 S-adenosylmethionine:tRNA ribosyltransferase-isomerase [Ectobacillus antri]